MDERVSETVLRKRFPMTAAGLATGVIAVSAAAIFIRLADAAALSIAAYRLVIASAMLVPVAVIVGHGKWPRLSRTHVWLLGLSALFLALHFATWIASLEKTSVASSVVLVTANPLLVILAARFLFGEPVRGRMLAGIGLGLAGAAVLGGGDLLRSTGHLYGDLLALAGAACMAGYTLIGRRLRTDMDTLPYVAMVYSGAAVLLVGLALTSGAPMSGFTVATWGWLLLVALVPQVVGHSLLNWSLARVTATTVTVSLIAEPVISTLLAAALLAESPPWTSVLGGVIILAGVWLALSGANMKARSSSF